MKAGKIGRIARHTTVNSNEGGSVKAIEEIEPRCLEKF
jgi:hypothetical protein